jgi:hypothetical protein
MRPSRIGSSTGLWKGKDASFFEKKEAKKLLVLWLGACHQAGGSAEGIKVFLLLFLQKKKMAYAV